MKTRIPARPSIILPVYLSGGFNVVHGVNEGDPLSFADELVPDDIYHLAEGSRPLRLSVDRLDDGTARVAAQSCTGKPGARLHLDACLTLMSPEGAITEVLVIVEVDQDNHVNEVYALPLAALQRRTDYQLVGIDREGVRRKLAEVACASFTKGTHITMANGIQRPIEDLEIGDPILTRDNGPQQVRWIGHSTVRAIGAFAPICIAAGALANSGDLLVSPNHHLFIYQREDTLGVGRKEVYVRASHLINGDTITRRDGGFVEYYQILFDSHQIIYAEGIAAETLLLDQSAQAALLPELDEDFTGILPAQQEPDLHDLEVARATLQRPDALDLLRRASRRRPYRPHSSDRPVGGGRL